MSTDLPAETVDVLRASGWEPGRTVSIDAWRASLEGEGFVIHNAATHFLSEFGGLFFNVRGAGVECAREPFETDPTLCSGEADRFIAWGERVGRSFAPIGELNYGHFFLAIDGEGALYLMADSLSRLDVNEQGLDMLIRGRLALEILG